MKKIAIYAFLSAVILASTPTKSKLSFKDVSSLFGGYPFEDISMMEFDFIKGNTLIIKNIEGDIVVKTGTENNKVYVTAIKRAGKQELLQDLLINHKTQTKEDVTQLLISTTYKSKQTRGAINYVLTVPEKTNLTLSTDVGNISVTKADGSTQIKTGRGAISINQTNNKLIAHNEYGPITINHARGQVKALTETGDISLKDVSGTIVAEASKGSIQSTCTQLDGNSKLVLHTEVGSITVGLPVTASANFYGKATKGTLVSELPLTLKPLTTKLDSTTWKRFKQEIDGTFGTGEAEIRLSSNNGNIKIVETT